MRKAFFLMLALAAHSVLCAATHLQIEYLDGSDYKAALSAIARLEIAGDKLCLVGTDGEVLAEGNLFDDVRAVVLTDIPPASGLDGAGAADGITVYPNPTTDLLMVSGLQNGEMVRVFTADGRLAASTSAGNDGKACLQTGTLANGTYLLQAGIQIVKIIKQ